LISLLNDFDQPDNMRALRKIQKANEIAEVVESSSEEDQSQPTKNAFAMVSLVVIVVM